MPGEAWTDVPENFYHKIYSACNEDDVTTN